MIKIISTSKISSGERKELEVALQRLSTTAHEIDTTCNPKTYVNSWSKLMDDVQIIRGYEEKGVDLTAEGEVVGITPFAERIDEYAAVSDMAFFLRALKDAVLNTTSISTPKAKRASLVSFFYMLKAYSSELDPAMVTRIEEERQRFEQNQDSIMSAYTGLARTDILKNNLWQKVRMKALGKQSWIGKLFGFTFFEMA